MIITNNDEAQAAAAKALRARKAAFYDVAANGEPVAYLSIEAPAGKPAIWRSMGRKMANVADLPFEIAVDRHTSRMKRQTAPKQEKPARREPSLNERFDEWLSTLTKKEDGKTKPLPCCASYRSVWRNVVGKHGDQPMASMTKADYNGIFSAAIKRGQGPSTINRAHTLARQLIEWADHRHDLPSIRLAPLKVIFGGDAPAESEQRQVVVELQDWIAFWHWLDTQDRSAARLLQLIMLTGHRKGAALGARHGELTPEAWTVPAERMKGRDGKKKPHAVPHFAALDRVLARSHTDSGLMFGTDTNGAPSKERTLSHTTLNKWIERFGLKGIDHRTGKPEDATIHDLRRSMCSYAIRFAKVDEVTAQRMIAHTVQVNQVAGAYAVEGVAHVDTVADGWRQWADWIESTLFTV
ncbi:tyrosine-type recombinase/integrase [Enterobacter roggenkampii]|mgnify:FL=1|uniref:tyrosine-type recombinase/integrase n=1 Tax=Enterobacter roggenkampii TaxID=1812935 RepID=UPI002074BF94|nr:hypothetical protein [Enterobacter roggenkampii]MCM7083358.1 hypothetical protein [Enterobacter roggenkampii]